MTLENLLGLSLESIAPGREQTTRLLVAAERNLQDARLAALSNENRFDAAYKAVMQLSIVVLQANGFRTQIKSAYQVGFKPGAGPGDSDAAMKAR